MSKTKVIIASFLTLFFFGIGFIFFSTPETFAANKNATTTAISSSTPLYIPPDQFSLGKVIRIENHKENTDAAMSGLKTATVLLFSGTEKNQKINIDYGGDFAALGPSQLRVGSYVVIVKTQPGGEVSYYIVDTFRLPAIAFLALLFFAAIGLLGRKKGLGAVVGLMVSVLIISLGIVPAILAGYNALLVGLIGTSFIACLSIYLAHGYNRKTTTALVSTLITLVIAFGLSVFSIWGSALFGLGSEEAKILSLNLENPINFQGLLIVAIILGTLGVLDDTTINQTYIVHELAEANPTLSKKELYLRSLKIGREHIASLVNTLFLAYIGAFLPLFIALSISQEPLWVTINREMISEEIIRSIMGSLALILAVPISSLLAARNVRRSSD